MERKDTGKNVLIAFLVIIVIALVGLLTFNLGKENSTGNNDGNIVDEGTGSDVNDKDTTDEVINQKVEPYNAGEYFAFEKLTADLYGFVVAENDKGGRDLKVLNKNSDSQTIASVSNGWSISGLQIKANKLYFYISYYKDDYFRLISIDLKNFNVNVEVASRDFDTIYYYDVNDRYVFAPSEDYKGVLRYDKQTKEVITINPEVGSRELFVYNNKLYVAETLTKYYTMDFDGKNLTYIDETAFKNALNQSKLKYFDYNPSYLIFNNKKIEILNDKVLFDDSTILTTTKGKYEFAAFEIAGFTDTDEVIIYESKGSGDAINYSMYYKLNVKTGNVENIGEDGLDKYISYLYFIIIDE